MDITALLILTSAIPLLCVAGFVTLYGILALTFKFCTFLGLEHPYPSRRLTGRPVYLCVCHYHCHSSATLKNKGTHPSSYE